MKKSWKQFSKPEDELIKREISKLADEHLNEDIEYGKAWIGLLYSNYSEEQITEFINEERERRATNDAISSD